MQTSGRSWLPIVAVAAGALLALFATLLVLWSKQLVKDAASLECAQRAAEVVDEVGRALDERLARVRRGERPAEVARVWRLDGGRVTRRDPPDALDPPAALVAAARGERPLPITLRGPGGDVAATWLPDAAGAGALVQWDLAVVERDVVQPALAPVGPRARFSAGLVHETETQAALPFRTKAHDAFPPPLGFWRVGVGLVDPDAARLSLRVQTLLLGALSVWLLAVLAGSVWVWSRREAAARRRLVAREQFLARAYHELQTPLALLRAAAETIENGAASEPDDLARCAGIVVREEARLTRTVRRLLRILRLEGGGRDDLAPARAEVEAVVAEQKEPLGARGIALEADLAATPADALAPRDLVGDVVRELLVNVEKHARGATRVALSLAPAGRNLRLVVEDDGEPDPAAPQSSSTGLGLSLVREGLDLAGGSLEVGDGPAGGRRVVMEVPCRKT